VPIQLGRASPASRLLRRTGQHDVRLCIHGTKGDAYRLAAGDRVEMITPDRRRFSTQEVRTELEDAREALGIHNVAATLAREVYIEVCLRRVGRFHARRLPGCEYI
jgi:hypothetical protein